jgi:alkylated DNA repair dioxygenase AlkB
MPRTRRSTGVSADLFAGLPPPKLPEGFAFADEAIPARQARELAEQFATLPFKPFEFHGYLGNRRVVSFGWRYDYGGGTLRESGVMPAWLQPLRERAAQFAALPVAGLQQILVTEYAPGAGIGWHRDKPMFDDVVAFSFVSACTLRFRRRQGPSWERASQVVPARSVYLLRGPSRREWEHSIPPVSALRYSVTFRTFVPGDSRQLAAPVPGHTGGH